MPFTKPLHEKDATGAIERISRHAFGRSTQSLGEWVEEVATPGTRLHFQVGDLEHRETDIASVTWNPRRLKGKLPARDGRAVNEMDILLDGDWKPATRASSSAPANQVDKLVAMLGIDRKLGARFGALVFDRKDTEREFKELLWVRESFHLDKELQARPAYEIGARPSWARAVGISYEDSQRFELNPLRTADADREITDQVLELLNYDLHALGGMSDDDRSLLVLATANERVLKGLISTRARWASLDDQFDTLSEELVEKVGEPALVRAALEADVVRTAPKPDVLREPMSFIL